MSSKPSVVGQVKVGEWKPPTAPPGVKSAFGEGLSASAPEFKPAAGRGRRRKTKSRKTRKTKSRKHKRRY